ncbi:hypothetical protein CONPUDRAFT_154599 [Coniophora puteana RWD-64-598 SS2]|uniref:Uncharacterized protein n=1 Tax=Coniophora puteana (strain RWD-64-598) TaxID=741705 RepID=A0A5M3MN91_CONPW|nr:uncharacterized protein CONPUDRAFT_154599 [Coniophora puteana RWD-64-598 SS2]EIW80573.1 hypothetical protein CONPUDRAFT_154599 [Coniophora puteana RWD-64-598 SS2]
MYARVISALLSLLLAARPWFVDLVYHTDIFLLGSSLLFNAVKPTVDVSPPPLVLSDHGLPLFSGYEALDPLFSPHVECLPCDPSDPDSPRCYFESVYFNRSLRVNPRKALYTLFTERLHSFSGGADPLGSLPFDTRLDPQVSMALALVFALSAVWTLLFSAAGAMHAFSMSRWWQNYVSSTHPTLDVPDSSDTHLSHLTQSLLSVPSTSGLGGDITQSGSKDAIARLTETSGSSSGRQDRCQWEGSPLGTSALSNALPTPGTSPRQPWPFELAVSTEELHTRMHLFSPNVGSRSSESELVPESSPRSGDGSPDSGYTRSEVSTCPSRNASADSARGEVGARPLPTSPSPTVNPNDDFWMDAVNDPDFAPRLSPRSDGTISNPGSAKKPGRPGRYRPEKRVGFALTNQHIRSQSLDSSANSPSPSPRNPSLLPIVSGPRRYAKYVPPHRRVEGEIKWTTASPGPHGLYLGEDSARSTWTPFDLEPPRSNFIALTDLLSATRSGGQLDKEVAGHDDEDEEWKGCDASPPDWRNHRRSTSLLM